MNTLQKFKIAPSTVKENKLNIFSPYQKKKTEMLNSIIFEDEKYKVELKGYKLNQIHKDIIDIATYHGKNSLEQEIVGNRAVRLFSLYEVQKHLNYKSKNQNKWIDDKFIEMQQSLIQITNKEKKDWVRFNIIEVAKYSEKQQNYVIVMSEAYMLFFENEISINYKHYLPLILSMNAQSKALTRYILSHSNSFKISLDKALHKIGIVKNNMTIQNFRYNRRKILENEEILKKLNINFSKISESKRKADYMINYRILPKIQVFHPQKQTKGK